MLPRISVVIPLYNSVSTIARAIDSALHQEGVEVEVIVVDDGSFDGSAEVAARYGNRITLLRQANAGPAAARNRGVRVSRCPVITFLDADDEFVAGSLSAHMRCREQVPDATVTIGSFRVFRRDGQVHDESLPQRVQGLHKVGNYHRTNGFRAALFVFVPANAVAIDREQFDSIGGFDERLISWEVSDFMLRLLLAVPHVFLLDEICVYIHETPASQSTRTHGTPRYLELFAEKMIDVMDNVPASERALLARQIKGFLHALWASGAIQEFKRLTLKARPLLRAYGHGGKLELAASLPTFALRTLRQLPRLG
jgi:glycosyltransferase involved in cell wall biosynthesis